MNYPQFIYVAVSAMYSLGLLSNHKLDVNKKTLVYLLKSLIIQFFFIIKINNIRTKSISIIGLYRVGNISRTWLNFHFCCTKRKLITRYEHCNIFAHYLYLLLRPELELASLGEPNWS